MAGTSGFKALGAANQVQIDDTYANLMLVRKGRIFNPGGVYPRINIYYTGPSPMLFLRTSGESNGRGVAILGSAVSGDSWTWTLVMSQYNSYVDYYIYDRMANSSDGYGMRIRNASGQLTFDSGNDYLNIQRIFPIPTGMNPGVGQAFGDSGGMLAWALSDPGTLVDVRQNFPIPNLFYYPSLFGMNTTQEAQVYLAGLPISDVPAGSGSQPPSIIYTPSYLIGAFVGDVSV